MSVIKVVQRTVLVTGMLFVFNAHALEDTLENREREAMRYTQTINMSQMIDNMMKNIAPIVTNNPNAPKGEAYQRYLTYLLSLIRSDILTDEWLTDFMHRSLVKTFTADELKAMADFYASPEGQTIQSKLPQMMSGALPEFVQLMKDNEPLFKTKVIEYLIAHPELKDSTDEVLLENEE